MVITNWKIGLSIQGYIPGTDCNNGAEDIFIYWYDYDYMYKLIVYLKLYK